jgi:hypothetical protein
MQYRNPQVALGGAAAGDEYQLMVVDPDRVARMRTIASGLSGET